MSADGLLERGGSHRLERKGEDIAVRTGALEGPGEVGLHGDVERPATEREFQNVAKLRLNVLFAGSTEVALRACVLLGIVATFELSIGPLASSMKRKKASRCRR